MNDSEHMSKIGKKGGLAGTGIRKVRGTSAYYSKLSRKRKCCLKRKRKGMSADFLRDGVLWASEINPCIEHLGQIANRIRNNQRRYVDTRQA